MWRSLLVGLVAEPVRVTALLPDTPGLRAEPELLPPACERLWWRDSGWNFLRRARLLELAETLKRQPPDVLHVWAGELWSPGLALAQRLNCPVVLYAGSRADLAYGSRLRLPDGGMVAFAGATVPLVEALGQQAGAKAIVAYTPSGVHVGHVEKSDAGIRESEVEEATKSEAVKVDDARLPRTSPLSVSPQGGEERNVRGASRDVWCLTVTAGEAMDVWLESALRALAELHQAGRGIQVFLDSPVEDPHALWQMLHRLDLTGCASIISRRVPGGRREPLWGADALIHPQPLHRARGLLLATMARGLPLLAAADAMVDDLIEDRTAWLVHEPEASAWRTVLERLWNDPAGGAALGQSARAYVREQRTVAAQVRRVVDLYHQLTARPLPFQRDQAKS